MSPPENESTCAYAGCAESATVALRFGDGTTSIGFRQTEVVYCSEHTELVKRLFLTCDERPVEASSQRRTLTPALVGRLVGNLDDRGRRHHVHLV